MTILDKILEACRHLSITKGFTWGEYMTFKDMAEMHNTIPAESDILTRIAEIKGYSDGTYIWIPELQKWTMIGTSVGLGIKMP